jgi:hypothetical protein
VEFFKHKFSTNPQDTLFATQHWRHFDNRISLNGFIGKREKQLQFSAGAGARSDNFETDYIVNELTNKIFSNYLTGSIGKEALDTGQWFYNANAMFIVTGEAAGSSTLQGEVGKDLGKWATLNAGFKQDLNLAPYAYTIYQTQYDTILTSFNKESITLLHAGLSSEKLKLSGGVRSYLISNYIYINEKLSPSQYAPAFNVTQVWLRKMFTWRSLVFDNEGVYQAQSGGGPINVPLLMARHQLSLERYILKHALKVATGVEVRYHSPYNPSGYSPYFNRFYFNNTYEVSNVPETSIFFNFKVKRFRAYIMADQFQQIFTRNIIMMIRFGFNWVMIN